VVVVPRLAAMVAHRVPSWTGFAEMIRIATAAANAVVLLLRLQNLAHVQSVPLLVAVLAGDAIREGGAVRVVMIVQAAPETDAAVIAFSLPFALSLPARAFSFALPFAIRFSSACFAAFLSSFALVCHRNQRGLGDPWHGLGVEGVVVGEAGNSLLALQDRDRKA